MSNNDSIDEETKRILAEVEPDAQSRSNDSKESIADKVVKTDEPAWKDKPKDDSHNTYETNTKETDDSEW